MQLGSRTSGAEAAFSIAAGSRRRSLGAREDEDRADLADESRSASSSSEATAEDRFGRTRLQHGRRRPPAVGRGQPPGQGRNAPGPVDERSVPSAACVAEQRCRARRPAYFARGIDTGHGDSHRPIRSPRRSASARASPSARACCRCRSCSKRSSRRTARSCRRDTAARSAQERGPAGRVHVDLPDLEPLGQRAARVRELLAAAAGVRRHRMPAARPHLSARRCAPRCA